MDNPQFNSNITLQCNRIVLPGQIQYDLEQSLDKEGIARPRILGHGRFASVYAAKQLLAGQSSRSVAFKVLHEYAKYEDELLFSQEVALNREFTSRGGPGIGPLLDVLLLGTLVLCGCGTLYHPTCPKGCGIPLERIDLKGRKGPTLRCSACDYELSAEKVTEHGARLHSRQTKPCCTRELDVHADRGTIINFARREVMIMEVLEENLADHARFLDRPSPPRRSDDRQDRVYRLFGVDPPHECLKALEQKVSLLGKVNLMVRIADTVVWLHEQAKVVHKDLAPDNIMVRQSPTGVTEGSSTELASAIALRDRAANQSTHAFVIDFGLSDKEKLTRSWYDEGEIRHDATTKLPYLSPEARYQRQEIGTCLEFDRAQRRFWIPADLAQAPAGIRVGDIISDKHDPSHAHDITVVRLEGDHAYFDGDAPKSLPCQFEIIRPLGEAHDVYALGAVFYYILTGRHDQVEALAHFASAFQELKFPLEISEVTPRDTYDKRRDSIREPFFRDEMLLVILRAMVRGLPRSFVKDRTERGSGPAQKFLWELKQIQQKLFAEVFAVDPHPQRSALAASVASMVAGWTSRSARPRRPGPRALGLARPPPPPPRLPSKTNT